MLMKLVKHIHVYNNGRKLKREKIQMKGLSSKSSPINRLN